MIFQRFRLFCHRRRKSRQGVGELVVTVEPGDLFNQVDFAFDVQPPARDSHRELGFRARLGQQLKTECAQQTDNFAGLDRTSENALYFLDVQHDGRKIQIASDGVDGIPWSCPPAESRIRWATRAQAIVVAP